MRPVEGFLLRTALEARATHHADLSVVLPNINFSVAFLLSGGSSQAYLIAIVSSGTFDQAQIRRIRSDYLVRHIWSRVSSQVCLVAIVSSGVSDQSRLITLI